MELVRKEEDGQGKVEVDLGTFEAGLHKIHAAAIVLAQGFTYGHVDDWKNVQTDVVLTMAETIEEQASKLLEELD
jgi:hypothetical protein